MYVALDLSILNTGFACWEPSMEMPVSGIWRLASGLEWSARAYCRLQKNLIDLHKSAQAGGGSGLTSIIYEDSLPAERLHGQTNRETLKAAVGLTEHVESFGEAFGIKTRYTNQSTWRRHFLGKMKRGTRTATLKHLADQRCRELGFRPQRHDEAEALGMLDFELHLAGLMPPWRDQHVLEVQMVGGGGR